MTEASTLERPTTTAAATSTPVTANSFVRAETDLYFGNVIAGAGGIGLFHHIREPMPIDNQTVIRGNRDTLYSGIVLDLDAGPATVTPPDSGSRFMSMQVFDEDQYSRPTSYAGGVTLSRDSFDTRYALVAFRTLVNPTVPGDLEKVHALQDAITVSQPGGPGKWEIQNWEKASQKKVRDALLVLASTVTDMSKAFGSKDEVDPVQRLWGAASAWGANPPRDAIYLNLTPELNDGQTTYRLKVPPNVPVDGFWSVSVYGADGYYKKNALDRYTLNNLTAQPDADGSVMIQFGGCDSGSPNCIPIMPGWNYMVRLYRPRPEVINGSWKFPEAQPIG